MTDTLRDWADTCEARALDALDTSPALAPRVQDLVAALERIDTACREQIEAATLPESDAIALFAQHIRDLARTPL